MLVVLNAFLSRRGIRETSYCMVPPNYVSFKHTMRWIRKLFTCLNTCVNIRTWRQIYLNPGVA